MIEKKYEVFDEFGHRLASNMTLTYALIFMKAVCEEYYGEPMDLRLKEMDRCEEAHKDE